MTPNEETPITPTPQDLRAEGTSGKKSSDGKHPVLIYITILFIAAFLLMGLSFLSSQRRNSQALGELQSSMSALQNMQYDQNRIIDLQEELAAMQDEIDSLEQQLKDSEMQANANSIVAESERTNYNALHLLYQLQQNYLAKNYDKCRSVIEIMEFGGYDVLLSEGLPNQSTEILTPSELYQQIKESVSKK